MRRTSPGFGAWGPVRERRTWSKRALRVKRSCSQVSSLGIFLKLVSSRIRWMILCWKVWNWDSLSLRYSGFGFIWKVVAARDFDVNIALMTEKSAIGKFARIDLSSIFND